MLGPGPSQHQWLQGRVRLRLTPAPTLQAAGAQATRVHTAHPRPRDRLRPPGVTITADRGLQSRRPRPLALHLRQSTKGLGLGLGPAGRRRLLGVLPVHAGGTREPGADGAVGTGPATELRRPSKETLSVPDNSQREALSKRAALKCVQ